MKKLIATAALLLLTPFSAWAQSENHPYRGQGYGFFGLGTGLDDQHPLTEQLGFGGEGFLFRGFGVGAEATWSHYRHFIFDQTTWIGSLDGSYHFRRHAARGGVDPFVLGGFSIYGPTSKEEGGRGVPGGNFGGGVNLWFADHSALRLEYRVHVGGFGYLPGSPAFAFRVGMTFR